ncbi:MAG: hypothetical protein ABH870_02670 [bacterium]
MKKLAIDFDQYKKENKMKYLQQLTQVELRFPHRVGRGRPRDAEKHKLLLLLDYARMKRRLSSGEIERISTRVWRVNYPEVEAVPCACPSVLSTNSN